MTIDSVRSLANLNLARIDFLTQQTLLQEPTPSFGRQPADRQAANETARQALLPDVKPAFVRR